MIIELTVRENVDNTDLQKLYIITLFKKAIIITRGLVIFL